MSQENTLNLSPQHTTLILTAILSLFVLVGMGIDLIAPSLPAVSQSLHVATALAKNLIAMYLVGYTIGTFFAGFLSDTVGRRPLVVHGLWIFSVVSLLPTFFPNIFILLLARFLQGLTLAACAIVARAVLSDILSAEKLLRIATLTATMWGIGPIIGPAIGGYLQHYFNWPANFYFFFATSTVLFLIFFFAVPETHLKRQALNFQQNKNNFLTIFRDKFFLGLGLMLGLTYSLLIVFNTLGPFLIQTTLGYSAIYFGHVALVMGMCFLVGTIICRALISRYPIKKIISYAVFIFLSIAVLGLILASISDKNIWIILAISFCMFFACGILYPACLGKALSLYRHIAGSSAAIMNLINISLTSIGAFVMGCISANSSVPMTLTYVIILLLCSAGYVFILRKNLD